MTAPFQTIVVGSDGQRGRAAAVLAQAIASATGARLVLVGVASEPPLPLAAAHAQAHAALECELLRIRDELAPAAETQVATDVSAAHALRRVAETEDADLLVVGTMHRSRLQRLTSADRAMQVLHGAPCAVAVAPDHLAYHRELRQIGVGIDGTPESEAALGLALELARLSAATLRLLAVAGELYPAPADLAAGPGQGEIYRQVVDGRLQVARDATEAALRRCRAEGVRAIDDVRVGEPAAELSALSADCDLLVLGSRRWGPIRRIALGATAERVIRDAQCPVLVPPRHAVSEHGGRPRVRRSAIAS